MGYLWYSAGLLDDFEVRGLFAQGTSSQYARTPPYCYLNNGDLTSINRLIKYLPEDSNEIWMSTYVYFDYIATNYFTNLLTAFNTTTNLFSVRVAQQTGLIYTAALIGSETQILAWSNMALDPNKGYQVEVHYIRHSSAGLVEVWLNGTLIFSFTGNTGDERTKITGAGSDMPNSYPYNKSKINYSDFIFTNQGRIGNKRPVLLPLSDSGDANNFTFQDMIGNQIASYNDVFANGYTYIFRDQSFFEGTLKRIFVRVNSVGTITFGTFAKDLNGKYTPKKQSKPISLSIVGEHQLISGSDFEEMALDRGDFLGFYCSNGLTVPYRYDSYGASDINNDTINTAVRQYSGNGFLATAPIGFEETYRLYRPCIYALYDTSPANFYETSKNIARILNGATLKEQQQYASFSAANKLLCNIGNIAIECTSIKSVRISAKAQAGLVVDSGDFLLKIAGSELAQTKQLPTTNARVEAQFDGAWTLGEINAAQIGFTVKASDAT